MLIPFDRSCFDFLIKQKIRSVLGPEIVCCPEKQTHPPLSQQRARVGRKKLLNDILLPLKKYGAN